LTALGRRRNGAPIWPVKGGAPDDDTTRPATATRKATPLNNDDGGDDPDDLGDAGKRAIDRMKADRNAARQELKAVRDQLAKLGPLQKLADALGAKPDDGPTDIEALTARLAKHEEDLAAERALRWRAEVAQEKGLTAAQAKRLVGKTRDELAADADDLLKTFVARRSEQQPARPAAGPVAGQPRRQAGRRTRRRTRGDREAVRQEAGRHLRQHPEGDP
jgi:hypothetical protein